MVHMEYPSKIAKFSLCSLAEVTIRWVAWASSSRGSISQVKRGFLKWQSVDIMSGVSFLQITTAKALLGLIATSNFTLYQPTYGGT